MFQRERFIRKSKYDNLFYYIFIKIIKQELTAPKLLTSVRLWRIFVVHSNFKDNSVLIPFHRVRGSALIFSSQLEVIRGEINKKE